MVFYPAHQLASLTQEGPGRCRAVLADGQLAFCPEPPAGPWTALDASLVNPAHIHPDAQGVWRDPQRFAYSAQPAGLPLQPPAPHMLPELEVPALSVKAVRRLPRGRCLWLLDDREVERKHPIETDVKLHPWLLCARDDLWLNPYRLRRLQAETDGYSLILDDGTLLDRLGAATSQRLAANLGLPRPDRWDPEVPCLEKFYLRDFPEELFVAAEPQLQEWFSGVDECIANVIYQALRYRQLGTPRSNYGKTHEGFMYLPLHSVLNRMGFLDAIGKEKLKLRFLQIINELANEKRLFTYQELGFKDAHPGTRRLGDRRPEVVLLVEKESMQDYADELADLFGVSYLVTGGLPKLLATEYLVKHLRALHPGKITLIALVDFDAKGWSIAEGQEKQFNRYGMELDGPIRFLVRAQDFTEEEIRLFSYALSAKGEKVQGINKRWVAKSGGINGKARGMYCNMLQPIERLIQRMREVL